MSLTREDIERIKAKPPEERTSQENKLANLTPWPKGVQGNPEHKNINKTKTISNQAKRLLNSPMFLKTVVKTLPKGWDNVVGETSTEVIVAGLITSVVREVSKSITDGKPLSKETRMAIMQLNKLGFGEQVTHKLDESFFQQASINFNVVEDRKREEKQEPNGEEQPQQ